MRGPAVLLIPLLLLALTFPAEAGSVTVRYVLPTGFGTADHAVAPPVGAQPCIDGCPFVGPLAVGSPVVVIQEPATRVGVFFTDDFTGQDVATSACLSSGADGVCLNGFGIGPICGPYIFAVVPAPAETHIHAYTLFVDEDQHVCSTSKGTATVFWDPA